MPEAPHPARIPAEIRGAEEGLFPGRTARTARLGIPRVLLDQLRFQDPLHHLTAG